ncbi:MAG: tetratricopeptide repeat protein [Gammaproteobacteria bacterium]|nr:tetratricopeptide repeat protein [Gammaproteobacteria bacterium]
MCREWSAVLILLLLTACAQQPHKEAEDAAKPVIKLSEDDSIKYNKALSDIKRKRYKQADAVLDKLIASYPDAAGPLANKAVIFSNKMELVKAEQYFLKALEKNDKLAQVRNNLAVVYRKKGEFGRAKEMLEAAIVSNPYYANAYYNLAILYELYLQQPEKALENYQLYLDLTKAGDKQVTKWISMLQRQIKAGRK